MNVLIIKPEARQLSRYFDQMVEVYKAAFAGPPYHESTAEALIFTSRLPYHSAWPGFRCVVASRPEDQRVVGFAYGYDARPNTWWYDQVHARLVPEMRKQWLKGAFEFVELAVFPEYQGQGIGGRLHDELLFKLPHSTAVLSTPQVETNALHLYDNRGWITLIEKIKFPGVALAYRIMGKRLGGNQ